MAWFLLAMVVYPEVQKKCQEELDMVVGRSRMPTFEDRDNLPYIRAAVRETFRWRSVAPIGQLLSVPKIHFQLLIFQQVCITMRPRYALLYHTQSVLSFSG